MLALPKIVSYNNLLLKQNSKNFLKTMKRKVGFQYFYTESFGS